MTLRVLLADDHALFREALRMVLELTPDIEVVAEVGSGLQVLEAVNRSRPDVVCMDVNMPGLDGVEATRQLQSVYPAVKVIGLSAHVDLPRVAAMCHAGAMGYVVKGRAGAELPDAIRQAALHLNYFSVELRINNIAELSQHLPHSVAP
jgi:two-component system invasion response regulator UvrY